MGELAQFIKTRFMQWYYSSTKAARFTRHAYRLTYYTLFEYCPRVFYVLDDRELIYINLTKAACTSIRATIGRSYGINIEDGPIHASKRWHKEENKLPSPLEHYYKFTFVRNPFSRLVSCYADRLLYRRREGYHTFIVSPACILSTGVSFTEFVHAIVRIPDRLADYHVKSQYATLHQGGRLLANWIGHIETIERDWDELAKRFNLNRQIEFHRSARKRRLYEDYRSLYTPELADMVYKRYRRDFLTFGYEDAYQELLDFITGSKQT